MQRRSIAALLSLTTLAALGCGANSPDGVGTVAAPPAVAPQGERAIPTDLRTAVARAEALGRMIYRYDKASAIGTDALFEQVKSVGGQHVGGYLTLRESDAGGQPKDSFLVLFFTAAEEPQIAYKIRVPVETGVKATVEELKPPVPPGEGVRALIRGRQNAIAALREIVQPINPLVFPGEVIGEDGIVVYLLAGTKRPQTAVLGKHYRVLLSADGRTVRRFEPLSRSVIEIPLVPPDPGGQAAGIFVSHLVTEYPLETHTFASLLYRLPVFVGTARGKWRITEGRIGFLGEASQ
jgi:hypothetical protein